MQTRNIRTVMCLSTILAVLVLPTTADAMLFVDDDAAAGGDGTSWGTAYQFLQDALSAAGSDPSITEIRVAQGTHKPDRDEMNPDGTGDREATFQLRNGVLMIGGYAGVGAGVSQGVCDGLSEPRRGPPPYRRAAGSGR